MSDALLQGAMRAHQAGNHAEAVRLCRDILRSAPRHFPALNLLGYLHSLAGQFVEAERALAEASAIHPAPETIYNRGCMLQNLARQEEALTCFQRAAAINPDFLDAIVNCGIAQLALRRFAEALANFDRVLERKPDDSEAWNNRGNALLELGRYVEALASFDKAIALNPDYANAFSNRGVALQRLNRHGEAIDAFERALALHPRLPAAHNNLGNSFTALRRYEEAYAEFERASALDSNFVEPVINRATTLVMLRRLDEAIAVFDRALRLKPDSVETLRNRANAFVVMKRFEEAVQDCEAVLAIDPAHKNMKGILVHNRLQCCDWRGYQTMVADIAGGLRARAQIIPPFENSALCRSPADHLSCARIFASDKNAAPPERLWRGERYRHDRIRIAYLSADFRNHAVASLIAGVFEHHDRERFETVALSFGGEKKGAMRERIERGFERFLDVERKSEQQIAQLIRDMEIDIAVDLMGYTGECRPGILAFRPAPIQVNYLGYPGSTGADHMDYIIADRVVIPESHHAHYSEKVAYLPYSYLPQDSRRPLPRTTSSRAATGLPEHGFVFCSFNNSYKFTPELYDIWMRLLHVIPRSVLWVPQSNAAAMRNLKLEAGMRGISPERIVFAPYLASGEEHIARMALADLFLDTLPFNAHTTAADALWAGVPILTCRGATFAGRVAASLLSAAGVPELITDSLAAYETRAREVAQNPARLAEIRQRVARSRVSSPLFDTGRFTRSLESAYLAMWNRQQQGRQPESLAVEDAAALLSP